MPVFVGLLRAVNVGGTGKLPMSDLKQLCEKAGFRNVRTYIASGNVVAERDGAEAKAKAPLEVELGAYAGKPVGVIVRTATEMAQVAALNPFPERTANHTVALASSASAGRALTENSAMSHWACGWPDGRLFSSTSLDSGRPRRIGPIHCDGDSDRSRLTRTRAKSPTTGWRKQ
jgi:hypothetical protein